MTKDKALKLALVALENISTALREDDVLGSDIELMLDTIAAIKEALEQPPLPAQNEELKSLVKELFDNYLNRVEESDSGRVFSPISISCCRALMLEPLSKILDRMAELSDAKPKKVTYDL